MAHLVRLGWILAFALVAFFGFRASIGKISEALVDSDPSANSREWAARPAHFTGSADCGDCHEDLADPWANSTHKSVECETCHGPAEDHAQTGSTMKHVTGDASLCGLCHGRLVSRPEGFAQVDLKPHAGDVACTDCHSAHSPRRSERHRLPTSWEDLPECLACHQSSDCGMCHTSLLAEARPAESRPGVAPGGPPFVPHDTEGRVCLSCHGPDGLKPVPSDHAGRTGDVCLTCHTTASAAAAAGEAGVAPASPPVIPHNTEAHQCLTCHGPDSRRPRPADHVGRTEDICLSCHQTT